MPVDSTSDRRDDRRADRRGSSRERGTRHDGHQRGGAVVDDRRGSRAPHRERGRSSDDIGASRERGGVRDRDRRDRYDDDQRRQDYGTSGSGRRDDSAPRRQEGSSVPPDRERGRDRGLPPPPPRPSSRLSQRPGTSPPLAAPEGAASERGTPGSAPRKGTTPRIGLGNPWMEELLQRGKLLASKAGTDDGVHTSAGAPKETASGGHPPRRGPSSEAEADVEPGELRQDGAAAAAAGAADAGTRKRRRHSPIIWDPSGSKQARGDRSPAVAPRPAPMGGTGLGLLERAQLEAAALRSMSGAEFDPDAPAALKSSPSLSSDPDAGGAGPDGHDNGGAHDDETHNGNSSPASVPRPPSRALASRWLAMGEQAGDPAGPHSPSPRPAASQPGRGGGGGGGGGAALNGAGDNGDGGGENGALGSTPPPPLRFDMRKECRDVHEFEKVEKISEGTYGVVYKAREKATGRMVALKRVKMEHEVAGFPVTSVREINILLNFRHPNIVTVEEVVVSPRHPDQIYMVMEYMDHDLKSLMEDKARYSAPFSAGQVKCLMQQLLAGLAFLHAHWVLHRDLKTSNILYNGRGDLKLCDFGMARQYGEPLGAYTHNVVTLWYRAPELLFGATHYSTAMDVWSVGCIMGEILTGKPLLPGQGEFDQIDRMVQLLGTPTNTTWPGLPQLPNYRKVNLKQVTCQLRAKFAAGTGYGVGTTLTEAGLDLLSRLLAWDPAQRITAEEALKHRWFQEVPLPVPRVLMPTFAPRKAG